MEWSEQKQRNYHTLQWVNEPTLTDTLTETCGRGEALLELGCGTGTMISRLAERFDRCVGVDPATYLLQHAPAVPNVEYVPSKLEDLNYESEFDCVLVRNTIHHLADPEAGVAQAKRALRRGGKLVVCQGVPPHHSLLPFYRDLFALFDKRHLLTEADIITMFRTNGFREIALVPVFMANVDLIEWLRKVSPNEEVYSKALALHREGGDVFRRAYEVQEDGGKFTMTWRFMIISAVKP